MTDYAGVGFLYSTSDTVATLDLYGVSFPYSTSDTVATFNLYGVAFPYSTSDVAATFNLYGVEYPYSVPNVPDAKFTPDLTTWAWATLRPQLPVKVVAPITSGSFDTLPPLFTAPVNARTPLTRATSKSN